jgi:isocitrate/isopropylmalate dehydrogenase
MSVNRRPHTSASVRMHTYSSIRTLDVCKHEHATHTAVLLRIRQHTSAYVSIRQHTLDVCKHADATYTASKQLYAPLRARAPHTSAYVSIRQHASACVSIRQHTSVCSPARVCSETTCERRIAVYRRRMRVCAEQLRE